MTTRSNKTAVPSISENGYCLDEFVVQTSSFAVEWRGLEKLLDKTYRSTGYKSKPS